MTRPAIHDPYQRVARAFNRAGVEYVVVGLSGVNYYALSAADTFTTLDYDLFLKPTLRNVERAVRCLRRLGFDIGTAAGQLGEGRLAGVVRQRRTLVGTTTDGTMVELLLKISGYAFTELARDAVTFTVRGVPIKVGRLTKLLQSKQLAGRPKDRQFLQRYRSLLNEKPSG